MSLRIDRVQLDIIINGDQSRIRLRQLEDQSARLKKELKKLPEESDAYVKKSAELRKVQAEMDGIIEKIGITGLSYKELTARQRELNAIMKNMDPNLKEYKALETQLKQVTGRIKELKNGGVETDFSFKKLAEGFNKYVGIIAAFTATIVGVVLGIKKATDAFIEFEDRLANLSSLTGLNGKDLDWLGDQAKKLSVTTTDSGVRITKSATEIVDAFTIMGSKKPELLENKEALAEVTKEALILAEAAKMDTKPAVEGLAITMNQFGASASEAGRYINVLAAGSKAGAAEIPSITESILKFGAAAKAGNISVEQSVGLVETLAEKGIEGEVAGTGLRAMLVKLQSGADDTNPKIVGLNKALENLAAKNLSAKEITKMFGLETYTVAQTIISSVPKFIDYTKAVTGTNVAIEQATINTQTNKAALAQSKNEAQLVAIAFGEKLIPALTAGTNAFTLLLKAGLAVINFLIEHKSLILSAIAGITAYTLAVNAQTIATKAYELATTLATKATQFFNTVSKGGPWGWLAAGIAMVVTALLTFKRTQEDLTSKGFTEFNAQLKKEKDGMNDLFEAVKKTKEGTQERTEAIKKLNEKYGDYTKNLVTEKSTLQEIEKIQKLANDALIKNIAIKSRQADIEEVVTKTIEKQKEATLDLLTSITRKKGSAAAGSASLEIKELTDRIVTLQNAGKNKEAWAERTRFIMKYGLSIDSAEKNVRSLVEAQKLQTRSINEIDTFYNSLIKTLDKTKSAEGELNGDGDGGKSLAKLSELQKQRIELYRKYVDEKRELDSALTKSEEKELREALRSNKVELSKNLDAEEKAYADHLTKLNTDYYNARLKSEDDLQAKLKTAANPKEKLKIQNEAYLEQEKADEKHNRDIEDAETAHLITRIAITKHGGAETGKLEEQLAKHKIDILDRRSKEEDKLHKSEIKEEEKTQKTRNDILKKYGLEDFRDTMDEQLKILESSLDAENLSFEEKQKIRAEIADRFAVEMAEKQRQRDEEREKNADKQILANRLGKGDINQQDYNKKSGQLETLNTDPNAGMFNQLANVKSSEQLQLELNKAAFDEGLRDKEAFEKKQNEITQKAQDERVKIIEKGIQNAQAITSAFGNFVSAMQDAELAKNETNKEAELKAAGDSATKKKAIEEKYKKQENDIRKKYADKQFIAQVAQIIASGALAVMQAFAQLGPIAGAVAAALIGGTTIAQISVANQERQRVKQLAKGKYSVYGANDGKLYPDVPYVGSALSGVYPKPTLISEDPSEPEMVLTGKHVKNLRLNYPEIMQALQATRVPQRAGGLYPSGTQQTTGSNQNYDQLIQIIAANTMVMQRVHERLNEPIEAFMPMDRFDKDRSQWEKMKSDVKKS